MRRFIKLKTAIIEMTSLLCHFQENIEFNIFSSLGVMWVQWADFDKTCDFSAITTSKFLRVSWDQDKFMFCNISRSVL